jgi:ABC transporter related protein
MSIKAENLNYIYNEGTSFEVYALKNVSFSINDGEFIGIIGHTGSGKSTLIQHLNGLLKANSGKLYFNGEDVYEKGYDLKKLRQKVGLVFQYPEHQLFEVDVLSDVCFGPINQGLTREEAEKKAIEALKMTGIDESLYKHSPFELSGGQKRRVAIAGVLAMNPEVLVLDEPTAGLDPYGRDEILDKVSELREQTGMSIVLVSHSMEDIAKYVSRLMVMSGGEKIFDDTPKEVFKHYKELENIGLAAPQLTYVIQRLRAEGVDISDDITTVEEAKAAILKIYNSQKEQI